MFIFARIGFILACSFAVLPKSATYKKTCSGAFNPAIPVSFQTFSAANSNPMADYMSNLTTSVLPNTVQQCVYIALNIVLSYYDTYLNDDIFDNGYERPSLVTPITDSHGNLIDISVGSMGSPAASYPFDEDFEKSGQSHPTTGNLLQAVGTGPIPCSNGLLQGLTSWGLNSLFAYDDDIPNSEMCSYLDSGIPVITNIGTGSNQHCVVAFSHDGFGQILFHNGYPVGNPWNYPTFGALPLSEFSDNYVIAPLQPIAHVCSTNYVDSLGNPICPCMIPGYCLDPSHVHVDSPIDDDSHLTICPLTNASAKNNHSHHFDSSSITFQSHSLVCSCGNQILCPHSLSTYEYVDYQGHHLVFDDGCVLLRDHIISSIYPYGTDVHRIECVCGAWGINHHFDWAPFTYHGQDYYMCVCGFAPCPFDSQEEARAIYEYLWNIYGGQ